MHLQKHICEFYATFTWSAEKEAQQNKADWSVKRIVFILQGTDTKYYVSDNLAKKEKLVFWAFLVLIFCFVFIFLNHLLQSS